jgi:hypothetical protein
MEFENHWDLSPFPDYMYEPVLKLQMRDMAGFGPECDHDDSKFEIKYDPSITAGRYSRPPTQKEIEVRKIMGRPNMSQAQIEQELIAPLPYDSTQGMNVIGGFSNNNKFAAKKMVIGSIIRVKAYGTYVTQKYNQPSEILQHYRYVLQNLRDSKTPIVSQHPEDFLLYAYRNYINMPSVDTKEYDGERRFKDVRRIEMCLHSVVMTQVFKLRLQDYPEVESNWYCLASTEVNS